jgi:acetoin utilization deacetylase AcuC-like enzyme
MHCQDNFPFTKATSTWDIPLAVGMQDEEYLATLQSTLFESLRVYRPDFVLYDAGVDISQHDVLGKLKVSDDGIFQRDYFVLKTCFEKGIPVCAVIGGGYDASLPRLVARHSLLFRAAIKVWNHE